MTSLELGSERDGRERTDEKEGRIEDDVTGVEEDRLPRIQALADTGGRRPAARGI